MHEPLGQRRTLPEFITPVSIWHIGPETRYPDTKWGRTDYLSLDEAMAAREQRLAAFEIDAILPSPLGRDHMRFILGEAAIRHPPHKFLAFVDRLAEALERYYGAELPPPAETDRRWMPPQDSGCGADLWDREGFEYFRVDGDSLHQAWMEVLTDLRDVDTLHEIAGRLGSAPLGAPARRLQHIQPYPTPGEPVFYLEWKGPSWTSRDLEQRPADPPVEEAQVEIFELPLLQVLASPEEAAAAIERERGYKLRCSQGYALTDCRPGEPLWFETARAAQSFRAFRGSDTGPEGNQGAQDTTG